MQEFFWSVSVCVLHTMLQFIMEPCRNPLKHLQTYPIRVSETEIFAQSDSFNDKIHAEFLANITWPLVRHLTYHAPVLGKANWHVEILTLCCQLEGKEVTAWPVGQSRYTVIARTGGLTWSWIQKAALACPTLVPVWQAWQRRYWWNLKSRKITKILCERVFSGLMWKSPWIKSS